jgi:hypothetical protein
MEKAPHDGVGTKKRKHKIFLFLPMYSLPVQIKMISHWVITGIEHINRIIFIKFLLHQVYISKDLIIISMPKSFTKMTHLLKNLC